MQAAMACREAARRRGARRGVAATRRAAAGGGGRGARGAARRGARRGGGGWVGKDIKGKILKNRVFRHAESLINQGDFAPKNHFF